MEKVYTPEAAAALTAEGEALRARLNALGEKHGLPFQATGYGSLMNIHFVDGELLSHKDLAGRNLIALDLFHLEMIAAGIYITRRGYMALSLALTEDDHDYLIGKVDEFLATYGKLIAP